MDDLERLQYIFDIQGYLVIPNILTSDELAELNRLMDAQNLPGPEKRVRFGEAAGGARESGPGFLAYGKPFCDLLDHERIMPILRMMLGDYFRLDRIYGMYMDDGMKAGRLHGGQYTVFAGGILSCARWKDCQWFYGGVVESTVF